MVIKAIAVLTQREELTDMASACRGRYRNGPATIPWCC